MKNKKTLGILYSCYLAFLIFCLLWSGLGGFDSGRLIILIVFSALMLIPSLVMLYFGLKGNRIALTLLSVLTLANAFVTLLMTSVIFLLNADHPTGNYILNNSTAEVWVRAALIIAGALFFIIRFSRINTASYPSATDNDTSATKKLKVKSERYIAIVHLISTYVIGLIIGVVTFPLYKLLIGASFKYSWVIIGVLVEPVLGSIGLWLAIWLSAHYFIQPYYLITDAKKIVLRFFFYILILTAIGYGASVVAYLMAFQQAKIPPFYSEKIIGTAISLAIYYFASLLYIKNTPAQEQIVVASVSNNSQTPTNPQ